MNPQTRKEAAVALVEADQRHTAGNTIGELVSLTDAEIMLTAWLQETVKTARDKGESWLTIGNAIGVTRQAAQQHYGLPRYGDGINPVDPATPSGY
jgi:hypothetical protein